MAPARRAEPHSRSKTSPPKRYQSLSGPKSGPEEGPGGSPRAEFRTQNVTRTRTGLTQTGPGSGNVLKNRFFAPKLQERIRLKTIFKSLGFVFSTIPEIGLRPRPPHASWQIVLHDHTEGKQDEATAEMPADHAIMRIANVI